MTAQASFPMKPPREWAGGTWRLAHRSSAAHARSPSARGSGDNGDVRLATRCAVAAQTPRRRARVGGHQGMRGFLLYWAGGVNDQGRPAYYLGVEFLKVFGIAVSIGVVLIVIGGLVRAAARFDAPLLRALNSTCRSRSPSSTITASSRAACRPTGSFPDLKLVGIAVERRGTARRLDRVAAADRAAGPANARRHRRHRTTQRLLRRAPDVRVVALTPSTDEARMMGVLRAGATGYVRKDAEPEMLVAAVSAVAGGRTSSTRRLATAAA